MVRCGGAELQLSKVNLENEASVVKSCTHNALGEAKTAMSYLGPQLFVPAGLLNAVELGAKPWAPVWPAAHHRTKTWPRATIR
jgi:hypothetical protein